MKTIEFTIGSKALHLYMNGEAMFAIQDLDAGTPEGTPDVVERMMQNDVNSLRLLCQVANILATQGEHCRRYLQYSPERIPSVDELLLLLTPMQLIGLRSAVIQAINAGYSQPDADDDGDIDTGLAELEKKTKL